VRRTVGLVAIVASLTWFAASCGGDDDDAGSRDDATTEEGGSDESDDTTTTAEDTSTTLSPEDEVLAAYEAASSDALAAAYDPPNPDHPDLLAHFDGEALTRHQGILRQLQATGVSYVGTIELHPTLTSLAGSEAVVEDCYEEHTETVRTETREPVGEPTDTILHVENHLQAIDGAWKIVQIQELSEPCTPG
jgi:hypothetical protein